MMAWNKVNEMEERMKFVMESLEDNPNISELCREYNISRSVGYKLLKRYELEGIEGLKPKSRRPKSCPFEVPNWMVCEIVKEREAHPTWGGLKIRSLLLNRFAEKDVPSIRSIERVLSRCGLVKKRRNRLKRYVTDSKVMKPKKPNDIWTVDFKGQWRMQNGNYCFPLTIRDLYSRMILEIKALPGMRYELVREEFDKCFQKYGLPNYIRSDNGAPFASIHAICGLSQLSAWWISLGIMPERIPPASPQLNGSHERMHADMKRELQFNPKRNIKDEQKRFDSWRNEYNEIRPHQALNSLTPSKKYKKSRKKYLGKELDYNYSSKMELRKVGCRGHIHWHSKRRFISGALVKRTIGIKKESDNQL
jgi:transposase InsO family protein